MAQAGGPDGSKAEEALKAVGSGARQGLIERKARDSRDCIKIAGISAESSRS